jgi:tripartite-type tricarboxylate transporter receptor subunit TctC
MITAATPDAIVGRLNAEIVKAFNDAKVVEFLEGRFLEPAPSSVEEFGAFLAADRAHVAQLVKKYKIPVQ